MSDAHEVLITEETAGARIDVFVAGLLDVSRARATAAIEAGAVQVNGAPARKSLRLEEGMRIVVAEDAVADRDDAPQAEDIAIDIVYEDDHLLVVSKPAGLVVHPAPGNLTGTLVNALLHRASPPRGGDAWRPGIVHRLDAGTSGLMIVAKEDAVHEALTAMLGAREIHRTYAALVEGVTRTETMTIDGPVGRDPRNRTRMAVVASGKDALTRVRVVERFEDVTLLDAMPHTGRTHQIRVHLSAAGHPIAGDITYGASGGLAAKLTLTRPFLHARALSFTHPVTKVAIELEDPLAADLVAALDACR